MMARIVKVSRRDFVLATAAGTGGLVLGIYGGHRWGRRGKAMPDREQAFAPNLFVAIDHDDRVTVWVAKSEMGQGVKTALPMLVADALDADWSMVRVEQAIAHPDYGDQATATSSSVRDGWAPLRQAGALARLMLIRAGAAAWQVPVEACTTDSGFVVHPASGRRSSYGALAADAARQPLPDLDQLEAGPTGALVGRSLPRVDVPAKCDGSAIFGIDVRIPGMLYASVECPPTIGGALIEFDGTAAQRTNGVRHVVRVGEGVAVVAENTWAAFMGRRALSARWTPADPRASTEGFDATFDEALHKPAAVARDDGADRAWSDPATTVEAVYDLPYLAHAPMEPPNCTIRADRDRCEVWAPTQDPQGAQERVAEVLDLPRRRVIVHTTYIGGGFGRRVMHDEVVEAAILSRMLEQPVQVIWSREDDIRRDHFRPRARHRLSASLDDERRVIQWHHRVISPSILGMESPQELDPLAVDGAQQIPYAIPKLRVEWVAVDLPLALGFWRSVGHSHNAFAIESFIDEVAHAQGSDPVASRLSLLRSAPRHRAVLERAAEAAGWGRPPAGRHLGVAVHESFGSYVAQVAEVSLVAPAGFVVHRITCAVDCGRVVHPDIIHAQVEGGIIFGLSAAWMGRITVAEGAVQQSNFHDYPVIRMGQDPAIEVHVIESDAPAGGIGEVAVPPLAPALANALYAASGIRVRRLPLISHPRFGPATA